MPTDNYGKAWDRILLLRGNIGDLTHFDVVLTDEECQRLAEDHPFSKQFTAEQVRRAFRTAKTSPRECSGPTRVFVSQFLQEPGAYDCIYVHLVPGLVAWLLERRDITEALPDDVLSVTFRVPAGWRPILMDECDDAELTDGFMGGHDTLMVPAEQFSFPEGALPNWTRVEVTKAGVVWSVDVNGDWLETYELPWENLGVGHD